MSIAVSGAAGLIGSALCDYLDRTGQTLVRLVRGEDRHDADRVRWDPMSSGRIHDDRLEGLDAVVHLGGANIAGRWSDARKASIRDSRVRGTNGIAQTLAGLKKRPSTFLCASAVGIYGDTGARETDEAAEAGRGFLADVCRDWESACAPAVDAGIRVVNLRFGVVLSRDGGALAKMLPPFRLGLGGRVGSGQQYMSWITLPDAVAAIAFLLKRDDIRGPVNLVSPTPVTNETFTRCLGRALHRPALIPLPSAALKLILGEMAECTVLCSSRVLPRVLLDSGFRFRHDTIEKGLRATLDAADAGD